MTDLLDLRLVHDISAAEGCRLVAYKDSRGFWTIGWGHLIPDQTKDWTGLTWTQPYADMMRDQDIGAAVDWAKLQQEYPSLDTPCRQNALCELIFNMGRKKWAGFVKCRAAIVRQDWQAAHDQLLFVDPTTKVASPWATEVGPLRSARIANYLLTGQYSA
jgi:lysozyme